MKRLFKSAVLMAIGAVAASVCMQQAIKDGLVETDPKNGYLKPVEGWRDILNGKKPNE